MRVHCLLLLLVIRCAGYELSGRIDPPAALPVYLHGATAPFEASTISDTEGHFRFRKLAEGTYTLAVSTAARGQVQETIELSKGTADSNGRVDIVLHMDDGRLESDGNHSPGVTVSATILSIPGNARKEYEQAQRCLARRDSDCAIGHLRRAAQMAPQFAAAWNQLGTIAYQNQRYPEAETNFRRALVADPEAFEPLVNLGGVLLNLGRPKDALGYNKSAVARRANDALANSQLGLTWFLLDDPGQAEKYLKIALELDPAHFSHPQLVLARIYMRRGDRESALAELRSFLKEHPDANEAGVVRQQIASLTAIDPAPVK